MYLVIKDNETSEVLAEAASDMTPAPGDVVRLDGRKPRIVVHLEVHMTQHSAAFTGEARFATVVHVYTEPHDAE